MTKEQELDYELVADSDAYYTDGSRISMKILVFASREYPESVKSQIYRYSDDIQNLIYLREHCYIENKKGVWTLTRQGGEILDPEDK